MYRKTGNWKWGALNVNIQEVILVDEGLTKKRVQTFFFNSHFHISDERERKSPNKG